MILALVQSLALLVTLAVGLQMLARRLERRPALFRLATGVFFGAVGLVAMMTPMHFAPGVIYDGRSVVLSLAGLFGGPVAAAVSAVMCGAYRWYLGGAGAVAGVGVVVESAGLGALLYYLRRRDEAWVGLARLWGFALLVHAIMLALQLLIPGRGWEILRRVGPAVLIFYPLCFLLIAQVFLDSERRRKTLEALQDSERLHRAFFEQGPDGVVILNPDTTQPIEFNDQACRQLDYSREEFARLRLSDVMVGETPDETRARLAAVIRDGKADFDVRHRTRLGEIRHVHVTAQTIGVGGRSVFHSIWRDITERKRMEEMLKEAERRYRNFVSNASEGIYRIDFTAPIPIDRPDAELIECLERHAVLGEVNETLAQMYGLTPRTMVGRPATDFAPEYGKRALQAVRAPNHQVTDVETVDIDLQGRPLHLQESFTGIVEDGILVHIWGTQHNITQRKQAEAAAAQARRNFDLFFETIDDLLFVLDREGRILHANQAVFRRLGYTEDELIGQPVARVHPPELLDEVNRAVVELFSGTTPFCTIPIRAKDGRVMPVETRAVAGEWNGRPALFGATRDLSQIQLSEEKFAKAFHASPVLMAISDRADGRYLEVNKVFLETLGYAREEVIGQTSLELGIVSSPEARAQWVSQMERDGFVRHLEVAVHGKDGTEHIGLFSAEPVQMGGQARLLTTMLDITARRHAEAALRQSLHEKETLLKEVHHRVKNNLQVVTSLVNLQSRSLKDPVALAAMRDTQARIRSMALLHENLYRSGQMDSVQCPSYLEHLCRHLKQSLNTASRGIALALRVSPPTLTLALDQAVPCGLIITELVTNACKHAFPQGRGGTVSVEFAEDDTGHTLMRVADDGVGLPPSVDVEQARTFGLDLVSGFARQIRATLTCCRHPGTCFEIRFNPTRQP